jgi:hypothetical protein
VRAAAPLSRSVPVTVVLGEPGEAAPGGFPPGWRALAPVSPCADAIRGIAKAAVIAATITVLIISVSRMRNS